MIAVNDDDCPFDWAEYNLPAELLSQAKTSSPAMAPSPTETHLAPRPDSASWPSGSDDLSADAR
ncbi:MAG TPA: hypothetical protein VIQ01_05560 [Burkholderiales bacterium]